MTNKELKNSIEKALEKAQADYERLNKQDNDIASFASSQLYAGMCSAYNYVLGLLQEDND